MGFLDNLFNQQKEEALKHNWKILNDEAQLEQLKQDSFHKPVVIFKHSIRCGISSMIKFNLESDWDFAEADMDFYYLDLINYRSVSNLVASDLGVGHQSPQVIVLKDGRATFDTSHHAISVAKLHDALA